MTRKLPSASRAPLLALRAPWKSAWACSASFSTPSSSFATPTASATTFPATATSSSKNRASASRAARAAARSSTARRSPTWFSSPRAAVRGVAIWVSQPALTLFAGRLFQLFEKGAAADAQPVFSQRLEHGQAIVLTATQNREFEHCVPKEKDWTGLRFSVVFRRMPEADGPVRSDTCEAQLAAGAAAGVAAGVVALAAARPAAAARQPPVMDREAFGAQAADRLLRYARGEAGFQTAGGRKGEEFTPLAEVFGVSGLQHPLEALDAYEEEPEGLRERIKDVFGPQPYSLAGAFNPRITRVNPGSHGRLAFSASKLAKVTSELAVPDPGDFVSQRRAATAAVRAACDRNDLETDFYEQLSLAVALLCEMGLIAAPPGAAPPGAALPGTGAPRALPAAPLEVD
eukprot:m.262546 g.262546  ORF g.262546 m.262546 type:complete len:402 (-) comp11048_c0_seq6:33-1238(-)